MYYDKVVGTPILYWLNFDRVIQSFFKREVQLTNKDVFWLTEVIPSCLSDVRQCQIVDMHYENDLSMV